MFNRLSSKNISILILFFSILTWKESFCQSETKTKIEELVDIKTRKLKEQQKQQERLLQKDTLSKINPDSLMESQEEIEDPEQALLFEKENFKFRNQVVKKRRPVYGANHSEEGWQKALHIREDVAYKVEHKLDSTKQVFGWHPYWMGNSYKTYNFSLLSTVAYFSYEMNPATGGYYSIHSWSTTDLIDSAHAHGCKVVLSVTNFGKANNKTFLSSLPAQRNFINTLITLLRERNADGVNIDFEDIGISERNALTNFIIDLSESLKKARKDYLVTIAIPAFDFDGVYDARNLNNYVDMYIIMGYEFHGITSKVAGPISPVASGALWWEYNLEKSINNYIISGITANKLLMGLPYYGAEWHTEDLVFPSKVKKFINYPMYRNIRDKFGKPACCEDEISQSKVYVYRDNQNNYKQIWYEDSTSLAKKYDWVKSKKLGGIGIWALGYDNGYTELWELLAAKFAIPPVPEKEVLQASSSIKAPSGNRLFYLMMRVIRNPKTLFMNPRPLIAMFGTMFGVSVAGFLLLYRYGYRLKRVWKLLLQSAVTLFLVICVVLIFLALKYLALKEAAFMIGGFILGCIIFLIYSRHFLTEKDLP